MKKVVVPVLIEAIFIVFCSFQTARAFVPLEPACIGEAYDVTVSITIEEAYFIGGSEINIDRATFLDVFNLPAGLRYTCAPCSAGPGQTVSVRIFGTTDFDNALGIYDLEFSAELIVNGQTFPITFPYAGFDETAYSIEVQDCDDNNCYMPIDFSAEDASCIDECDGTATAFPSRGVEPYSYKWDFNAGGQTSQTAEGLCSGIYWVTVTDATGCEDIGSVTVGYAASECETGSECELTLSSSVTLATCPDSCNGQATVIAANGTLPYLYEWGARARYQRTPTAESLCPGTYEVTVTDRDLCEAIIEVTVGTITPICEPNEPDCDWSLTFSSIKPTCATGCDGQATVTPVGGRAPYTYKWNAAAGNATMPVAKNLCPGAYQVTVTDSEGCRLDSTAIVEAPTALRVDALVAAPGRLKCGEPMRAICQARYGRPPYSYRWSTGATGTFVNSLPLGITTVTVTDANGCTATRTFTNIGGTETDRDCDLISFSAPGAGGSLRYSFNVPDSVEVGIWTTTVGNSTVNLGNSRAIQYTFPAAATYEICYTYRTNDACTVQCCKTIRIEANVQDCPEITRSFDNSSQQILLSLPGMENISWAYADTLVRDSILSLSSPATMVAQEFKLTYFDASCTCYRQCRSTVNLCPIGDNTCWNSINNIEAGRGSTFLEGTDGSVNLHNFPNPWSGRTTFQFYLHESTSATLEILNANGRRVFAHKGQFSEGQQSIPLEEELPPGIYFYRLLTLDFVESRSMMVVD